jgi:hypothetical protein
MTQYSGLLRPLNTPSSAPSYEEPADQKRARLVVEKSQGAPGVPSGPASDAIERNHRRQISEGRYSGAAIGNLPTAGSRGDESTSDDSEDQLRAAISANQARLRKTLENAGYSAEAIQTCLVELSTRTDETRADEGEYIVDRLRRENAERSLTAWQK